MRVAKGVKMIVTEEKLLTIAQVAERLQVRPEAVRRWVRAGKLKAFLPGGMKTGYRIRGTELQRFLEASAKEGEQ